jgi:hypothetical protein
MHCGVLDCWHARFKIMQTSAEVNGTTCDVNDYIAEESCTIDDNAIELLQVCRIIIAWLVHFLCLW